MAMPRNMRANEHSSAREAKHINTEDYFDQSNLLSYYLSSRYSGNDLGLFISHRSYAS